MFYMWFLKSETLIKAWFLFPVFFIFMVFQHQEAFVCLALTQAGFHVADDSKFNFPLLSLTWMVVWNTICFSLEFFFKTTSLFGVHLEHHHRIKLLAQTSIRKSKNFRSIVFLARPRLFLSWLLWVEILDEWKELKLSPRNNHKKRWKDSWIKARMCHNTMFYSSSDPAFCYYIPWKEAGDGSRTLVPAIHVWLHLCCWLSLDSSLVGIWGMDQQ